MPLKPQGRIFNDITETIGGTPLVRINRLVPKDHATVLAKCEFFNPLASVKDRIGLAMIEAGVVGGDLGGELTGPVQQAHVRIADGSARAGHRALDDGLLGEVDTLDGSSADDRSAAHQASPASSPSTIGTPMSEPYSVQEPS